MIIHDGVDVKSSSDMIYDIYLNKWIFANKSMEIDNDDDPGDININKDKWCYMGFIDRVDLNDYEGDTTYYGRGNCDVNQDYD